MTESPQALRAYGDYLAMGMGRSLEKLADQYRTWTEDRPPTRHLSVLKRWSTEHKWQERVRAHERSIAEQAEAQERERRLKMREIRIGQTLRVQQEALAAFMRKAQQDRISAYAAIQALQWAHDGQRKDMDEPDARVEVTGRDGGPITFTVQIDSASSESASASGSGSN